MAFMALLIPSSVGVLMTTLFVGFLWINRNYGMRPKDYPPGPPTLPFIGNLHQMPKKNIHYKFQELSKEYGPIVSLKFGSQTMILLNSAEAVRDLIDKRGGNYSSRIDLFILHFGPGLNILMTKANETWKRLRRMYRLKLAPNVVDSYIPYQTTILLHELLQSPDDWNRHIVRATASVGSTMIYGWRTTSSNFALAQALFDWVARFSNMAGSVQVADWYPFLRPIYRRMPASLNSFIKNINSITKDEREYCYNLFNIAKEQIALGKMNPSFCRDQLLVAEGDVDKLNENEVAFNSGHAWGAATDSTIHTINCFVKAMILYPETQAKAQREIDQVVGQSRMPVWEDSPNLPYIRSMVKETIRWMPVTPLGGVPHEAAQDDNYMGYTIPKGAGLIINAWTINNDESRFKNPRVFDPDRYRGDTNSMTISATKPPGERDVYTFGAGRRLCPGIPVVERTLFLTFSRILWAFNIERSVDKNGIPLPIDHDAMNQGLVVGPEPFQCHFRLRDEFKEKSILRNYEETEKCFTQDGNWSSEFLQENFGKA